MTQSLLVCLFSQIKAVVIFLLTMSLDSITIKLTNIS